MAIIKCKMCGGDLMVTPEITVAECEYCGTKQTVPTADNEKKLTLFARANRLRLACEFDKAAGIYESIVADFPEEAEAYWGLILCRYGIEYVDDPATGKKIPTCHRSSFDSVLEDSDFEQACENADAVARKVYRDEAKSIEEIRKGIIEVSGKEDPYDIFICYKETAENGDRTTDSVIAQDVYEALTAKGYRVFFSRITLEDKLGQAYEPYIFAALNSAKIMLAFGTDYEYYNAVWVKNEWSRFLKLMEKDKSKHLIPCYKGIDAYDMPKEFAKLQAQNMGKVGAMQDLLRGIEKILPKASATATPQNTSVQVTLGNLITRCRQALEDGAYSEARSFGEKILDADPENADAFYYMLLASYEISDMDAILNVATRFYESRYYQRLVQYAPNDPRTLELKRMEEILHQREEEQARAAEQAALERQKQIIYNQGVQALQAKEYNKALSNFNQIPDYIDVQAKIEQCKKAMLNQKKQKEYQALVGDGKSYLTERFKREYPEQYRAYNRQSDKWFSINSRRTVLAYILVWAVIPVFLWGVFNLLLEKQINSPQAMFGPIIAVGVDLLIAAFVTLSERGFLFKVAVAYLVFCAQGLLIWEVTHQWPGIAVIITVVALGLLILLIVGCIVTTITANICWNKRKSKYDNGEFLAFEDKVRKELLMEYGPYVGEANMIELEHVSWMNEARK